MAILERQKVSIMLRNISDMCSVLFVCVACLNVCGAADSPTRKVPKSLENGYSGDPRIALASFHTLLVIDTLQGNHADSGPKTRDSIGQLFLRINADIKKDATENGNRLAESFRLLNFGDGGRHMVVDGDVTRERIYKAIDDLERRIRSFPAVPRSARDGGAGGHVIFAWFEMEGEADGEKRYLKPKKGPRIDRDELRGRLEMGTGSNRKTDLLIFVTDACGTDVSGHKRADNTIVGTAKEPEADVAVKPGEVNGWKSLYFGHRGTVDIATSGVGKPAYAIDGNSVFATAFSRSFETTSPNRFVVWNPQFVNHIQHEMDRIVTPVGEVQELDTRATKVTVRQ